MIAPMAPEPCDTAVSDPADWAVREQHTRQALGLSPCGWLDLLGQGVTGIGRIEDVAISIDDYEPNGGGSSWPE